MSSASREILVKAICEAIPTYSISCFRPSKKMCKNITSVVSRFGGEELDKKKSLEEVRYRYSKSDGGMGFRDFQLFNKAMLAKQGWRFMTKPESLCSTVLKEKYYHNTDFISATNK
jgi:hypothetical protein